MTTSNETRWGLILVIWAAGLGGAAQYGKISVVFDRMAELYPLAGGSIGFTVSLVGLLGILFGVIAGMFVGAIGYRRTLVWALWVGAAMSALQAFHLPFPAFLATRVVEGLSHLGLVVAGPTLIAQVSSEKSRGLAMTLWSTFFGVAFALFAWAGRPVVEVYGLQAMFLAHAIWMAVSVLGIAVIGLPDDELQDAAQVRLTLGGVLRQHWAVYRSPFMNAAAVGWLFYTFCFVSLLTLLPPYIAPEWRTFTVGAIPLMSMISSMTFGVWLLRYWRIVQVIQTGFLISAGAAVVLILVPGSPFVCLVLAGALGLIQGASFALVPELNDTAADRASANGVFAQAGNFGNTIGTPILLAVVAVSGYGSMMLVSAVLLLMGAVSHVMLARARARS